MSNHTPLIPTNIITGFLGVGKTTAINGLLAAKPAHESWAVLVNEFGQIGIDQEMMVQGDGLHVKELAGGDANCPNSGVRFDSGLDSNADGALGEDRSRYSGVSGIKQLMEKCL